MVQAAQFVGRWSRQLASAGILLACIRFTWIGSAQAFQKVLGEFREAAAGDSQAGQSGIQLKDSDNSAAGKLKQMDEMLSEVKKGDQVGSDPAEGAESEPQAQLRRLVVDFGPERSDVYLGGRKVGKVPYVGHVHCKLGELVRVQVLPPQGPPISREVPCTAAVAPSP